MTYDTDQYWYMAEDDVAHQVTAHVTALRSDQLGRQAKSLTHARLYGNSEIQGLRPDSYSKVRSDDRLSLNVVKSCCDTVMSKIAAKQPKANFQTTGGTYTDERKARLLDSLVEGEFYGIGLRELAPRAFLDAAVDGTGLVKFFEKDGRVACERVAPLEVTVDDRESYMNEPLNMFQTKAVNRHVLAHMYPGHRDGLLSPTANPSNILGTRLRSDQIEVTEAWHLPAGKDAGDGRHVVVCGDLVLLDEEWTRDTFPIVPIRWCTPQNGFWGTGIAQELLGIQYELNNCLRTAQLSMRLHAIPKWLLQHGSKVTKSHLDDTMGGIIEYTGKMPELRTFQSVAPEIFRQIEDLYSKAYQITGISSLSAQAQKPVGLNSGKSLREFYDIETERFAMVVKQWEQFFLACAQQVVYLAKDIATREGSYPVKARTGRKVQKVDWNDVDLQDDDYVLQIYPTNMLPQHPAGRLEMIQELIGMGALDQATAIKLLDFPDLESVMSRKNAPYDVIDSSVEAMLDRGEYAPPEAFDNLELALTMVQERYQHARLMGYDEERLDLLRTYISQVKDLMDQAQPPGGGGQAAGPGGQPTEGAPPMAPPMGPPGITPN